MSGQRIVGSSHRGSAMGVAVVMAGCLLSFYLVGLAVIPVGIWMLKRAA